MKTEDPRNEAGNEIPFVKMDGAGNDFILIDNRALTFPKERTAIVSRLCHRTRSIGADGVILLEPAEGEAHFRMRYYNADGREAEMCGNGARCVALFASRVGIAGNPLRFETASGPVEAELLERDVRIGMAEAGDLRTEISWESDDLRITLHAVRSGVPHAVVLLHENPGLGAERVEDLPAETVFRLGRRLRRDPLWGAAGANVNFVEVLDRSRLAYRTYERGVEAETQACGTGAVAVGVVAAARGAADPPLRLRTSGGDELRVDFWRTAGGAERITLEGPARVNFRGHVRIDAATAVAGPPEAAGGGETR
jgi:diaminopimelate epimerase